MSKQPLVSIVTANYNYGHFLPECIGSVLQQTYSNWEYIFVDDNSTDNSREIVRDFINKYPEREIRLIHHMEGPGGDARPLNMGIKAMRGDYFAWLSSDDYFAPDKLARQVSFMEKNPDIGMTFTRVTSIDDDGKIIKRNSFINPSSRKDVFLSLMKENFINANTAVIRREVLEQIGGFIEKNPEYVDIWRAGDYFMWLNMSLITHMVGINEFLHFTRKHRGNKPYNSSDFGKKLKGLLFSMVVGGRDIFSLADALKLGDDEKVQVEVLVRQELGGAGYTDLLVSRNEVLHKNNPRLNEKILEKMKDYTKAQYLIKNADIYLTSDPERAKHQLEEGLRLNDRSDVRSIYALASMAKRVGDIQTAEEFFWEVLEKDFVVDSPFVTGAHFHLGEMELQRGSSDVAIERFKACISENPKHSKAAEYLNQLGVTWAIKNYWDEGAETAPFKTIADVDSLLEFELSGIADANMVVRHIKKEKMGRVMDIGCGIGRIMKPMSRVCDSIVGVDASQSMIEGAREYLGDIANAELYQVSDSKTLFPAQSFDCIYSMIVFMHIPRRKFEMWIKEARRLLKKDGVFWFQIHGDFGKKQTLPQHSEIVNGQVRAYSERDIREMTDLYFEDIDVFTDVLDREKGKYWLYCMCKSPK